MAGSPEEDLLDRALELPKRNRAALAAALLASLEDQQETSQAEIDFAWAREVRERLADVRNGTADLVDWDDVYKELKSSRRA